MKVTIFASTLNHELYIKQFLDSARREFGLKTKILIADLGSNDRTLTIIREHELFRNETLTVVPYPKGTNTLEALSAELPKIETDYVVGMSGDDVFCPGYGELVEKYELDDLHYKVMVNVTLVHTNEKLVPFKEQLPKWGDSKRLNRLKLSRGNPGTGPGAIYPVAELISALNQRNLSGLLIEDYFIYWHLIEMVRFVTILDAKILYRRHQNALGNQYSNTEYAKSIGFSVGLSLAMSQNPLEFISGCFLFLRWVRHIPRNNLLAYVSGVASGSKY